LRRCLCSAPPTSAAFTDEQRILKKAKEEFDSGQDALARWFVGKYKLPTNHSLYQNRTQADMMLEMYSDLLYDRASLRAQISHIDASGLQPVVKTKEKAALFARLNALNDSLGEPRESDDALIDSFEAALERGEDVDLSIFDRKPK
jgi:hypothetical protein